MKRYALVVGIGEYDSPNLGKLSKPANDAKAVAQVLRSQGDFQEVILLNGTKAKPGWVDYQTFDAELTKFLQQSANQDALIYFTGHGFTLEESRFVKRGYLATSSCKVKFKDKRIISQEEGFSFDDLNGLVQEANLSSLLMLLDCCHSGFLIEDDLVKKSLLAFSRNNYCLIAACRSFQEAYALKSKDHSVFTGELLESLLEENARQGEVSALDVFGFIDRALKNSGQEPIFLGMGGAIPVVSYAIAAPIEPDETCPYQGLEAFTEATARFFFGRRADVEALWQKLEQSAFVPVIGASGSGKSSLVRAGLIPALQQSGTNWTVLEPIKPGEEPLTQLRKPLEELVRQLTAKVPLANLLRKAPEGLQPLIEQLPDAARFLLVVDQFEEVFTVCLDEEEQARFIHLVTQVAALPNSRLSVVITMRADFVESCLHYESLKQLIQTQAVYLSPLTGSDLTDAIAKPAEQQGYRLTPALLAEIVKDTREEPGFLPLLQFALTKLWEYRNSQAHELTSEAYVTIGKLAGALDSHADQLYTYSDYIDPHTGEITLSAQQSRSQTEQDWIRAILLRLVRSGEGEKDTRQRQPRATLVALAGEASENRQQIGLVLESLIKGRLLVSERETIDLAHEALINGWQRLYDWCQESRELRRLSQRLEAARLEWEKDQQKPNLASEEKDRNLMMGGLLADVRQQWEELKLYLPDHESDEAFFRRSDEHEKNQVAQLQQALTQVKQRQIEAEKNEIRALCKSGEALFASNQAFEALLESLRAATKLKQASWEHDDQSIETQVKKTLQKTVYGIREYNRLEDIEASKLPAIVRGLLMQSGGVEFQQPTVWSVSFCPNKPLLATTNSNGVVKLWQLDGTLLTTVTNHAQTRDGWVGFSPDGRFLASTNEDASIKIWDLNGTLVSSLVGHEGHISDVSFSRDGQLIASAGYDGTVKVWRMDGQLLTEIAGHRDSVMAVSLHPNGQLLASAGNSPADSSVRLWTQDGKLLKTLSEDEGGWSLSFSPDGQILAIATSGGTIKLLDLDGNTIRTFEEHRQRVMSLCFSSDGQTIASAGDEGSLKLWNLAGKVRWTLYHPSRVNSISFSSDGQFIASAFGEGVSLWKKENPLLKRLYGDGEQYFPSVTFSPDNQTVATGSNDGVIKLWGRDGTLLKAIQGHRDQIWSIKFSSDGKMLATASFDQTVKLWRQDGTLLQTMQHEGKVWDVSFSPDGTTLISGGAEAISRLWDVDGSLVRTFDNPHGRLIEGIAFSPDGQMIAAASSGGTVEIRNADGSFLHRLQGHFRGVMSVVFSSNGQYIASSSRDATVKLWSREGSLLRTFRHKNWVTDVKFWLSERNTELGFSELNLISADANKTIYIWSIDGSLETLLEGHDDLIYQISLSPDGQTLASTSRDGSVILWNWNLDLDQLMAHGCSWVRDYLRTNPNVEEHDRHLCDGILEVEE